jgi:hypothetical protein
MNCQEMEIDEEVGGSESEKKIISEIIGSMASII